MTSSSLKGLRATANKRQGGNPKINGRKETDKIGDSQTEKTSTFLSVKYCSHFINPP